MREEARDLQDLPVVGLFTLIILAHSPVILLAPLGNVFTNLISAMLIVSAVFLIVYLAGVLSRGVRAVEQGLLWAIFGLDCNMLGYVWGEEGFLFPIVLCIAVHTLVALSIANVLMKIDRIRDPLAVFIGLFGVGMSITLLALLSVLTKIAPIGCLMLVLFTTIFVIMLSAPETTAAFLSWLTVISVLSYLVTLLFAYLHGLVTTLLTLAFMSMSTAIMLTAIRKSMEERGLKYSIIEYIAIGVFTILPPEEESTS